VAANVAAAASCRDGIAVANESPRSSLVRCDTLAVSLFGPYWGQPDGLGRYDLGCSSRTGGGFRNSEIRLLSTLGRTFLKQPPASAMAVGRRLPRVAGYRGGCRFVSPPARVQLEKDRFPLATNSQLLWRSINETLRPSFGVCSRASTFAFLSRWEHRFSSLVKSSSNSLVSKITS